MQSSRRTFLQTLAASLGAGALPSIAWSAPEEPYLLSSHGCGRATGYSEANKIITHDGRTHVAWLDSVDDAGFQVRIRTRDNASGEWSPVVTIGDAFDNHGGPALTIDSAGYLHICYYPHHHPMRYRRSLRPNDASEWTEVEEFGERTTYPTLVCGPDDTLYCTCRERSDGPWVSNLFIKKPGQSWEGPRTILTSLHTGYSHFMDALAWGPDHKTLHLCTRIYGGDPARGHTVGYLRSQDGGATWETSTGTPVELPATAETVDIIASKPEGEGVGLRAGSLAVDGENRPIIVYSDYDPIPATAFIARPDGKGGWENRALNRELPENLSDCGLITPGGICVNADGRLYLTLSALRHASGQSLWGAPNTGVVWLESNGFDGKLEVEALTPLEDTPRWLPNLERPTGHNRVERPSLIYTEGGPGEKNTQIVSNEVYWMQP